MGTWEHDTRTGRAIWDEQMWRLRGLEPRGTEAPPTPERRALLHPDDLAEMMREYAESAPRAQARQRPVSRALARRQLALAGLAVDPDLRRRTASEVRRLGVNWDVTQAREAEQALQERVLAQRESRAKSQFLARMSHELRTPLHAVIGFAQLLLTDSSLALRGEPREQLQHIHAAGEHLLALVNDMLDLSSLDTGEIKLDPQVVDLRALYDAAAPMVAPLAAEHGVRLDRDELAHPVWADPTRLRQVLLNLLTNAVKYNQRGGSVRVEADLVEQQVALRVRDSGRGMTERSARACLRAVQPAGHRAQGHRGHRHRPGDRQGQRRAHGRQRARAKHAGRGQRVRGAAAVPRRSSSRHPRPRRKRSRCRRPARRSALAPGGCCTSKTTRSMH